MFEDGLGRERDAARARALYALAPDIEEANIRLAVLRATGRGGPRDTAYARSLLERWAKQGETRWLEQLARAFEDGVDEALAKQVRARLRQAGTRG
jgi:TPR repeat protein